MHLSTDKMTSLLGIILAVLHQVGLVGVLPVSKQDWMHTGMSAAMALLGYFANKP